MLAQRDQRFVNLVYSYLFLSNLGCLFDVHRLFYCHRHDCEKLKSMCDNLGATPRSYVDSKQLFTILDCKMLVQYYCISCYLKLSRLVNFLTSILEYGVESVFPSCFADNADHGSIYCKHRETDLFILPSLNKSGVRTDCVTFT